ncbi:MAG: peptidoglycan DD-metalloendopeptidase family protein [Myxococcota bacterium]|nr:peptidoglycan DD-metalloendopeptidase family protein [Myxococcota bacterium]
MRKLNVTGIHFSPIIQLPQQYDVYDFTAGYDPNRHRDSAFGIGRYNEKRPTMYAGGQFTNTQRDIHVGIDIAAPVGTPVYAFYDGTILYQGDNAQAYDYGPTIVTQHEWHQQQVYALYGHLSRESLSYRKPGVPFKAGDLIGWIGRESVNGGWNPHVHFQLSLVRPETHDIPGVVNDRDRAWALVNYPDPRLVLGPLY